MSSKRSKSNLKKKDVYGSSSKTKDEEKIARQALISNLFPSSKVGESSTTIYKQPPKTFSEPDVSLMIKRTILGVEVVLPVKPNNCQMAVMLKLIIGMKEGRNCLLESPTGTGKTLALLCSALAWQKQEEERLRKEKTEATYFQNPKLKNIQDAMSFISKPDKVTEISEFVFEKRVFGEKSIYDEAPVDLEECNITLTKKRKEPDTSLESDIIAGIDKKPKLDTTNNLTEPHCQEQVEPNKDVTKYNSLPVIYYGARTHKQLEQVVQEFSRTAYAGKSMMTILSSRDYSCLREHDVARWPSKNDMCRACTKNSNSTASETNCIYYDNHKALKHSTLPGVFNLDTLKTVGRMKKACPYYAARKMAAVAHIVFCPYSYLIEPAIRKSMQINLDNNIVIIDEGHNIEDTCREAATFTFTQTQMQNTLKELKAASSFRFANNESIDYITYLQKSLEEWCLWFVNQKPLIDKRAVNDATAEYVWDVKHFADTLHNHNIGQKEFPDFNKNAEIFCKKFRDDPRLLVGITQNTNTVIENLDTVLGYLFRNSGECMDDYKPILRKMVSNFSSYNNNWSRSNFEQDLKKNNQKRNHSETLSLTLTCLNPAVLFAPLLASRCVVLASGTLSPMATLHSELGTIFPHTVSPPHDIPRERVWVGSLKADMSGESLRCDSKGTKMVNVQDALGEVIRGVCDVTPHGVLCFLPSYRLMNLLVKRWRATNLWMELNKLKHVFMESTDKDDHIKNMKQFDDCVGSDRGALILAVYRGKVAEGMDFKDHQARAVIAVGVPYPGKNTAVEAKMKYNDKYTKIRNLLKGDEWFKIQAYRALNQAVGRVVRHAGDWGAVLLVDDRYQQDSYCEHLAKWVKKFLHQNHHNFESLFKSDTGLGTFMSEMKKKHTIT